VTVRLIAITQPVIEGVSTPAELLAYCARVSSTANQMNHDTGPKLIRSLIRRKEWSPLEMVSLTMEISTTRDIARQILRHRSFSFQEFSQRYAVVAEAPIYREGRLQHPTDRQASVTSNDGALENTWQAMQLDVALVSQNAYRWALANGIAKEQARVVLPEGMTKSLLYVQGTLRSWWHYTEERSKPSTQAEHRAIAEAARAIVLAQFPMLGETA
jgi:thymidylate synthase (FAD)